uniref:Uncharacterized protein n=1 Tax=Oryza nivara TaxID=4536 RepID=A0A0E0GGP1_ORYNI
MAQSFLRHSVLIPVHRFFLEFSYHVGASYATAWTNLLCHVLRRFVHDKKVALTYCSIVLGTLGFITVIGINQICVFCWFCSWLWLENICISVLETKQGRVAQWHYLSFQIATMSVQINE